MGGANEADAVFVAMLYGKENDETLPRLTADDVAFDMDTIVVVDEELLSEESESDSEDNGGEEGSTEFV